jgi:hypothetical protein
MNEACGSHFCVGKGEKNIKTRSTRPDPIHARTVADDTKQKIQREGIKLEDGPSLLFVLIQPERAMGLVATWATNLKNDTLILRV